MNLAPRNSKVFCVADCGNVGVGAGDGVVVALLNVMPCRALSIPYIYVSRFTLGVSRICRRFGFSVNPCNPKFHAQGIKRSGRKWGGSDVPVLPHVVVIVKYVRIRFAILVFITQLRSLVRTAQQCCPNFAYTFHERSEATKSMGIGGFS